MDIFHQERFQNGCRTKPYFEGYYFRAVAKNGRTISIIPGISRSIGDSHSFVQIIDDRGESSYFRYTADKFVYSKKVFLINVGENAFSLTGFKLCIKNGADISGTVLFKNTVYFPKSLLCPSIMGPFSYVPLLECRHCVISVKSDLEGSINLNGENIDFSGGVGYIEKDWGCSFPSKYVWIQSNCFDGENAAFMLSTATVPVLGRKIKGLIAFLYDNGKFYQFATYSGACIKQIERHEDTISIVISSYLRKMYVNLEPERTGLLKAPVNGKMSRNICESGSGIIDVVLQESGRTVFNSKGRNAGIEICGDI